MVAFKTRPPCAFPMPLPPASEARNGGVKLLCEMRDSGGVDGRGGGKENGGGRGRD